ncbi:hypothetical protein KOY49_01385 [Candidatus Minimicrobia vallesae]|uniref:Uncharacterized protein n=1 Tax=Candidatus Minimicrobia vallesae TaxID=2841264 RepID=A0A8F1SAS1_9BACT|nr:hypothetical protein [Candidatus Minimicrobia vallesae]QWQ31868.1 hypothetical protein KOY49_01385 [Candidatus Minimicrobia vallesae]
MVTGEKRQQLSWFLTLKIVAKIKTEKGKQTNKCDDKDESMRDLRIVVTNID